MIRIVLPCLDEYLLLAAPYSCCQAIMDRQILLRTKGKNIFQFNFFCDLYVDYRGHKWTGWISGGDSFFIGWACARSRYCPVLHSRKWMSVFVKLTGSCSGRCALRSNSHLEFVLCDNSFSHIFFKIVPFQLRIVFSWVDTLCLAIIFNLSSVDALVIAFFCQGWLIMSILLTIVPSVLSPLNVQLCSVLSMMLCQQIVCLCWHNYIGSCCFIPICYLQNKLNITTGISNVQLERQGSIHSV